MRGGGGEETEAVHYDVGVYELTVQAEFCAAHAIWIRGKREAIHGHNWRVSVVVGGERLDRDGLLCDFHEVERVLAGVIAPWRDASLNDAEPFCPDGLAMNPTAEHVARVIHDGVAAALGKEREGEEKPREVRVLSVSVTEAPGCVATYRPGGPASDGREP